MIAYPPSLLAVGGARTGIAPVNLLDVEDINGNIYYWSDRKGNFPNAINGAIDPYASLVPPVPVPPGWQVIWILPTVVTLVQGTNVAASGNLLAGRLVAGLTYPYSNGSVTWSGFVMPPLPAGAIVESAYFTVEMLRGAGNAEILGPFSAPLAGASLQGSVEISDNPVDIDAASFGFLMGQSIPADPSPDSLILSNPAIAVYYSGATGSSGGYLNPGEAPYGAGPYEPWLLSPPKFTFNRSLQTDVGGFVLQNLSGDTLSRDFERILRRSAIEGAFFIYRCWQPDAEASWLEVHGTLSMNPAGVDTVNLKGSQLLQPAQLDTPLEIYCETCQIQWGGPRCGSTEATECSYSFPTCQVVERIMVAMNNFEKNFGETAANTALNVINRRRKI